MDRKRSLGLLSDGSNVPNGPDDRDQLVRYINIKLAALGASPPVDGSDAAMTEVAHDLIAHYREYSRLLDKHLCPADERIQAFLDDQFTGLTLNGSVRLPSHTLSADRHGLARELSLPRGSDHFRSDRLDSYRIRQGVLHNPKSDRRTTEGVFHVAEGGLPIPADKIAVPLNVYGNLLHGALNPPADLLRLPFTSEADSKPVEVFVSLLLRPTVVPEAPGFTPRKSMEVRFFAPGGLVSNLDFVESIFGNAGDPNLAENDAALDPEHWTGHTGCVILAPHLTTLKKKDLGLPHFDKATARQREQGMFWRDANEPYNGGKPFKITCRTAAGVMVTILADNYYGYSKKEVKTQISFSANLYGLVEEEHAGGALAFPCYLQGERFLPDSKLESSGQTFEDTVAALGDRITVHAEGYAVDKEYPSVIYVPQNVAIDLPTQRVSWKGKDGREQALKLLAGDVYVLPTGYKVRMEKHAGAPSWRLVGTSAEPTFCHKPCTVSGGGKSEISKSILGSIVYGPIYTADIERDLDWVEAIFKRDFSDRFLPSPSAPPPRPSRPVLSPQRSLGSVIKLLTPSAEFTPAYNAWLDSIPSQIRPLVFIIKRFYKPEWGSEWRRQFSVDEVNGAPGHQLKVGDRKLVGSYLRVGFSPAGGWRLHKLRQDYIAADKVQTEDDISASIVVPTELIPKLPPGYRTYPAVKIVENCEWRLFQRPDDAIHRGLDAQAEHDMAQPGLFASNYEAVTAAQAKEMAEDVATFDAFTPPMHDLLRAAGESGAGYVVSSANPRIVDGKPTKNPRYLQTRPDVSRPRDRHLAEISTRLFRRLKPTEPVVFPVSSVLGGRRNNPPDTGVRALAVYNPIQYQELPELFMDYVCSLTGKSPSTTGAGSEGALTKGPFNALIPAPDLNNALVGYILTGYAGFTTAAGYVGPHVRVDHDISLLIPEIWARLPVHQRDPKYLISNGYLEKLEDFSHNGKRVLASRLGYRITEKFVHDFFGKVFDNPLRVFDAAILRPETQDMEAFIDGVDNIVTAQQRVAGNYFTDGSLEACCPPLQALIRIMADGDDPKAATAVNDADFRNLFTRERLLESDWYQERLRTKQDRDVTLWSRHVAYLEAFLKRASHRDVAAELDIEGKLRAAKKELADAKSPAGLDRLRGTLGADPLGVSGGREKPSPTNVRERAMA